MLLQQFTSNENPQVTKQYVIVILLLLSKQFSSSSVHGYCLHRFCVVVGVVVKSRRTASDLYELVAANAAHINDDCAWQHPRGLSRHRRHRTRHREPPARGQKLSPMPAPRRRRACASWQTEGSTNLSQLRALIS